MAMPMAMPYVGKTCQPQIRPGQLCPSKVRALQEQRLPFPWQLDPNGKGQRAKGQQMWNV